MVHLLGMGGIRLLGVAAERSRQEESANCGDRKRLTGMALHEVHDFIPHSAQIGLTYVVRSSFKLASRGVRRTGNPFATGVKRGGRGVKRTGCGLAAVVY